MLNPNNDRRNHAAQVTPSIPNRKLPQATVLSFPSKQQPSQAKPKFSDAMLEWLEEADYNWADAPATF